MFKKSKVVEVPAVTENEEITTEIQEVKKMSKKTKIGLGIGAGALLLGAIGFGIKMFSGKDDEVFIESDDVTDEEPAIDEAEAESPVEE